MKRPAATRAQREAFYKVWCQWERDRHGAARSGIIVPYRAWRRRVQYSHLLGCYGVIVGASHLFIGIETDGYTHT